MSRLKRMVLGALLIAGSANAAPPASADQIKAQSWIDLASGLYAKGDFAGALAELQRAEPLLAKDAAARSTVRYNIARCFEQMNRLAEAVVAFEAHLEVESESARRAKSQAAIARLSPKAFGSLVLDCDPKDASLQMGEGPPVACGGTLRAPAGVVELTARAPGYLPQTATVQVTAGQTQPLRLALSAEQPIAAPTQQPEAGLEREAVTPADQTWPWVGVVSGGVLVCGGVVAHLLAAGARADAEDLPDAEDRLAAEDDFGTYRAVALGSYAVGAALLGTGLYFLLSDDDASAHAGFVPVPGGVRVQW